MKVKICPSCKSTMVKNGKTKNGKQKWLCKKCNNTSSKPYSKKIKWFKLFINWLFSKPSLKEYKIPYRTLSRHNQEFWSYWAMPSICNKDINVLHIDGLRIAKNVWVLIACTKEEVVSWYLARSENSKSWSALLSRLPEPAVVITDGNNGILKAIKNIWPNVPVQRCVFHIQNQIRRYTTMRPKLQAGKELYHLSKLLSKITTLEQAQKWVDAYLDWSFKWEQFLLERTIDEYGQAVYKHRRLRSARRAVNKVIAENNLFTYLNPLLTVHLKVPATNNRIEGGVNAQLRSILRNHRGMTVERRVKAIFWWCYYHSPYILSPAQQLKRLPTDAIINEIYEALTKEEQKFSEIEQWGDAVVWSEFHTVDKYYYVY